MFLKLIHLNLRPDERVVKIVHQSKVKVILPLIFSFLIYLASFFFLFYFISLGVFGLALFGFLLFFSAFYALIKFYFWYFNVLILTNKRIIDVDQKKFFERVVSDVMYHRVKDVVVKVKGLTQMLTRSGIVTLVLEGTGDNLQLNYIQNPGQVRDLIMNLRERDAESAQDEIQASKNEKIRQIYEEIKYLDEETLGKVYERLPEIIKEESEQLFFKR